MGDAFCPGSKLLRQPKPETIICPSCRGEVEIWSDEVRGTCPSCKRVVFRDAAMACLDWCKYGEQCVGSEVYARYVRNRRAVSGRGSVDRTEGTSYDVG